MFNNKKWEVISTIIIFGLVYWLIFKMIPWNLIFLNTTVAGGDMGSHNYILYHLKSTFPIIKSWSMDWYTGFPFLYFYPPMVFIISVIMSYLMPLNVAFKIATLLGTFLLPLALYWCLKNCNQKYPIPLLGLLGGMFFIFLEKFSIYGANIPSTLAGEFSYSFAFSLFFIFLGFLIKGLNERKYLILNIFLLAIIVLSHPLPVVIAALTAPVLIFTGMHNKAEYKRRLFYLFRVFFFAFCLTAFWALPFLAFQGYTSPMHWSRTVKLDEMFPTTLTIFQIFSVLGIAYAIKNREKSILAVMGFTVMSFLIFFALDNSTILNARFLPPFILGYILLGAYGLGQSIKLSFNTKMATAIGMIVLTIGSILFVKNSITYIPDWLKWNYEGFESKAPFKNEAIDVFKYLKTLPPGRIMWEYRNKDYDAFGTPRFLENLPIWTNHPTYEGLLIESSLTGPFHFVNQAEFSREPSSAIAGFEYPPFDFEKGIKHLEIFGTQYFLAYTPEVNDLANKYLNRLKQFEHFGVYELANSSLVTIADKGVSLSAKKKDWIKESFDWYLNKNLDIPIIFYKNIKEKNFIEKLMSNPQPITNKSVFITNQTDNRIEFRTTNLLAPHIVKVSYFPDWKVKGAYGPYLISPSFMVVFPYQENVTLEFKSGPIDILGNTLSLTSLILLGIISIRNKKLKSLTSKEVRII